MRRPMDFAELLVIVDRTSTRNNNCVIRKNFLKEN